MSDRGSRFKLNDPTNANWHLDPWGKIVLLMGHPRPLFIFFGFFSSKLNRKIVDFSGNQTRTVGVEEITLTTRPPPQPRSALQFETYFITSCADETLFWKISWIRAEVTILWPFNWSELFTSILRTNRGEGLTTYLLCQWLINLEMEHNNRCEIGPKHTSLAEACVKLSRLVSNHHRSISNEQKV